MNYRIILLVLLFHAHYNHATIVVQGNSTQAPYAFTVPVISQAYDTNSGTFFVGLASNGTSSPFTIAKALRPTFNTTPQFTPVLQSSSSSSSALLTSNIKELTISPQYAPTTGLPTYLSILIAVAENSLSSLSALYTDGSGEVDNVSLNDANGAQTSEIVNIVANSTNVFAIVNPNSGNLGDPGTGVALVGVGTTVPVTLTPKNAVTGLPGNLAMPLDDTSVYLTGGTHDVIFTGTAVAPMYWDDPLQRLYVGFNIESNSNPGDMALAIVVGQVINNMLQLNAITVDGAVNTVVGNQIGITGIPSTGVFVQHLNVLHASTGPDYLIVDQSDLNNMHSIYALPLVNDTSNPTSATNGTLARKTPLNATTHKFTVPAATAADLPTDDPVADPAATVGAGPLPIQASQPVSQVVVVGDAVYVAIDLAFNAATNDAGVFYSQAMFDEQGKISRWTPWSKRGVPLNAFPNITLPGGVTHNGAVEFLAVDGKVGNIWIVEGATGQTVGITSWSNGIVSNDILTRVNAAIPNGCYAVLDLDQATRGFLNSTVYRYALFGGPNKVVFTVTSQATDVADASSPQLAITDYSSNQNLITTSLPSGAGCCQALEYSRTSTSAGDANNLNYFFAGTENGLFVFADQNGGGFNALNLSTLNTDPFASDMWTQVPTISGSVVDIKTSGAGGTLYVLTFGSTRTNPLVSTLYSIPFTSNINSMFAASNIYTIAQTGVGVFSKVMQFFGMQIIATNSSVPAHPESKEQLVLATNQGLFVSNATTSQDVADARSQTDANWMVVATTSPSQTTATTAFYGVAGMDTPVRNTVWPFSIQDSRGFKTDTGASIFQYSFTMPINPASPPYFDPLQFNAFSTSPAFASLYPITYFFSDGGRRFFIFNPITDSPIKNNLGVIPYFVANWTVGQPELLSYTTLQTVNHFYWVKQIGATGILMAGTNAGVLGLQ